MEGMKITSIKVEVRRSYNYNSFGCELSADILDDKEDVIQNAREYLWTMANQECNVQIIEFKKREKEEEERLQRKKEQLKKLEAQPKTFNVKF